MSNCLALAVVLVLLFGNCFGVHISLINAGECTQSSLHPEWLWCDDFEGGNTLKQNYQDIDTTGFSISTKDCFDGKHSLQQFYKPEQVEAGWITRVNNNGFPAHLFFRWYHKFESGFQGFPPKMARVRFRQRSGDWKSTFAVHCWIDNGFVVADVLAKNSSQANSTGYLPIAKSNFSFNNPANIGRWVCFEMEVLLNTPGASDGLYRIWADDSLIVERIKVDLRGSENVLANEVMLDCYWNGGSPKAQNRYYDNFIISTKRIGCLKNQTKSSDNGSSGKQNSTQITPLQGYLKYNDKSLNGVYFTRPSNKNEQFYLIDGKVRVPE